MSDGKRSSRILVVAWGRMEVEGIGAGKDVKLYPGGGREWDWNETGTRHSPGIQPADVEELLARRSVTVHAAQTREAVRIYNDLADHVPVAGLFTRPADTGPS